MISSWWQSKSLQHFLFLLFFIYIGIAIVYNDVSEQQILLVPKPALQHKRKVWVSMGLCYSHNTNLYGKSRYPYKDVAPLALLLWKYHLPTVNTIVRIVYTEPEVSDFMRVYGEMLERTGAVVEWIPAGDMDCVLKSQLVR